MKQKVVIAGGTGFIGTYLAGRFEQDGFDVKIIGRGKGNISWDDQASLIEALEASELLINLAGKPITGRFTEHNKKELINSRISTTQKAGNAIRNCSIAPKLWINASGAHIYGTGDTRPHTENDADDDQFFLAIMSKKWEDAFFIYQLPQTRQIAFRTSIVLGKNGGALQPFINLTRFGLGGKQGNGQQKFSWIHIEDYYRIIRFLIDKKEISGPVNICSPDPVSNEVMMQTLRKVMNMPVGIPAPEFAIKIGTSILGVESDLVLKSLWVLPKVLTDAAYPFRYPVLQEALEDIIKR